MLDDSCKHLCAFYYPGGTGLFQFVRAGMGVRNSGITFVAAVTYFLQDVPNTTVYVDDIVVSNNTFDEHVRDLEHVLARLEAATIRLNIAKSKFASAAIEFLGWRIDGNRMSIVKAKQEGLMNLKPPKDKKDVGKFLAHMTYYRPGIKDYAKRVEPLTRLLRKGTTFLWDDECEAAFQDMINVFRNNIEMNIPTADGLFHVSCDASLTAYGAILEQTDKEGKKKLIACMSGVWRNAETRYCIFDLEATCLLRALEKWKFYLLPLDNFMVYTDSRALIYVKRASVNNEKFHRISMRLADFNFSILHINGVSNHLPDYISRHMADEPPPKQKINISKYQLSDLIAQIKVDVETLIPAHAVKKFINPYDFETDCDVPIKEQKQQLQEKIEAFKDARKRVEQENKDVKYIDLIVNQCEQEIELLESQENEQLAALVAQIDIQQGNLTQPDQIEEFFASTLDTNGVAHSNTPYGGELEKLVYNVDVRLPPYETTEVVPDSSALLAANAEFEEHFEINETTEEGEPQEQQEQLPPIFSLTPAQQADILVTSTLQSGILSIPEFVVLQQQDSFCKEVLAALERKESKTLTIT
jgi:DNA-dependent RNA polymerase auxiliary subunit epsilon